jgi:hypothetical protein
MELDQDCVARTEKVLETNESHRFLGHSVNWDVPIVFSSRENKIPGQDVLRIPASLREIAGTQLRVRLLNPLSSPRELKSDSHAWKR